MAIISYDELGKVKKFDYSCIYFVKVIYYLLELCVYVVVRFGESIYIEREREKEDNYSKERERIHGSYACIT